MTSTNDPAYVSDDTGVVLGTLITDQPLESLAAAAYDDVMVASMGACVTFNGVVRNHDGGQRVRSLSYTSHPTAEAIMATVADKVLDRHPDVRIWAAHRIGGIAIGEAAFVVHVASAHRAWHQRTAMPPFGHARTWRTPLKPRCPSGKNNF